MRFIRASLLIALTLFASLPICCCVLEANEGTPTCCHSQPTQEKSPCNCEKQAAPMEAKFATEALPAPILKLAENLFSIEAIANLHFPTDFRRGLTFRRRRGNAVPFWPCSLFDLEIWSIRQRCQLWHGPVFQLTEINALALALPIHSPSWSPPTKAGPCLLLAFLFF